MLMARFLGKIIKMTMLRLLQFFSVFYKKESCRRNEEEISKQHGAHYGLYISPYFQVAALSEFLFWVPLTMNSEMEV